MPGYRRKDTDLWWYRKPGLFTLIIKFSGSEATDPRDKIYVLLGLLSDAYDNYVFPPDYEKPLSEIVRDAARFMVFGTISQQRNPGP